jgi:hypothetical protein
MSICSVMNAGAWVLSALLLGVMLKDFVLTELKAKRERTQAQDETKPPSESP